MKLEGNCTETVIAWLIKLLKMCRHKKTFQLTAVRKELFAFINGVTCHQRTPATHVLVFMISSEDRRKKPYALLVQCVPYKGLTNAKIRQLANNIISEMVKRKMNVAGTYVE